MYLAATLVLGLIVIIVVHHFFQRRSRKWKLLNKFPGDYPLPVVGNALTLGFDTDKITKGLIQMWSRHGHSNFRLTLGNLNWIMVSEPADVGIILNHPTELNKTLERNVSMMPFFGDSLSTSEGWKWKFMRKLMSPSFQYKVLDDRLDIVNSLSEKLIDKLSAFENKGSVDLYRYFKPYMYDILCNSLFGVRLNMLDNLDDSYMAESKKLISIATENYYSYWRNIETIFKLTPYYQEMMQVIAAIESNAKKLVRERKKILEEIIEEIKTNNKNLSEDKIETLIDERIEKQGYLLDELIRSKMPDGRPMPEEMIVDEIKLMAYTGHTTSSVTMSHLLYYMTEFPEIQDEIVQEQLRIFGPNNYSKPNMKDLSEMKYLETVIKETMRYLPTVTKISRRLDNDLTLSDGRIVPAGTSVVVFYDALFQHRKIYPDYDKFNPERFNKQLPNYAFMPFSAGPRNCIGFRFSWITMKATLSSFFRRFQVCAGPPGSEPIFNHGIITESKNGVVLHLKTRQFA